MWISEVDEIKWERGRGGEPKTDPKGKVRRRRRRPSETEVLHTGRWRRRWIQRGNEDVTAEETGRVRKNRGCDVDEGSKGGKWGGDDGGDGASYGEGGDATTMTNPEGKWGCDGGWDEASEVNWTTKWERRRWRNDRNW
jgi:hypothetical protein